MNREYHKWFSFNLEREMELLVFGHSGRAIIFFPTRMARFFDYENWGIIDALKDKIEGGEMQLFCVDSIDAESFYNTQVHPVVRISRHLQYENYLIEELMPFMRRKNAGDFFETAGCSMGAYHAINTALRHPDLFRKTVGISGRYDLTTNPGDFRDLMDGHHNTEIYLNMPEQYIANLGKGTTLDSIKAMEIILAVGQTDPFLPANQWFSEILNRKGIPHRLYLWDGNAHKAHYWRKMLPLYL